MAADLLRCPRCGGNLLVDQLREADLCCLMCNRRWNLVERRLEPAQLAFPQPGGLDAPRGGRHRKRPPATDGFLQFHR